jgi:phosphoribosylformylglycinamidine cyclo-ligase
VNVALGDDFSAFSASICRASWGNSPHVVVQDYAKESFRGPRTYRFTKLPRGTTFNSGADGIGSKVVIITEALTHLQAAYDLAAMTAGDQTRYGGKCLLFVNVLDVSTLGRLGSETHRLFGETMKGLGAVAKELGIVLFAGETAELGPCVSSENPDAVTCFNWAGFMTAAHHPRLMITGSNVRPGDVIVALKEDGFRSNGMSSVRGALRLQFGGGYEGKWWKNPDAASAIKAAAVPSRLYDRFLSWVNGWESPKLKPLIPIKAIAHLSGGGIPSKLGSDILFRFGLSATLDHLWEPPVIMQQCASWRGINHYDAYKTWNGGQGVLAVLEQKYVSKFIDMARRHGHPARQCGRVVESRGSPRLEIHSRFGEGGLLEYT